MGSYCFLAPRRGRKIKWMRDKEEPPHPSRCCDGDDTEKISHVLQCTAAAAAAAASHCEPRAIRAGM